MLPVASDDFSARLATARLSPKMARLAAYLDGHLVQAAFMSTRELAAATGVSLATVVRFPRALGYPNWEAMRASIQDRINFDLTGVERLQTLPGTNRTPALSLRRVIDADIENLRSLAQTFSETQLERFISVILDADRVTVLGTRFSRPLAVYFAYSLSKVIANVDGVPHADSSLYDRVQLMTERDVLIVIAFARYPADVIAVARFARTLGKRVLAITDSPLSPLLPLADVALFARSTMLDFVGSLAAPAALINCIVTELGIRLGDEALNRMQAIEDAANAAGIYVPAGDRSPARSRPPVSEVDTLRRGVSP
jgi:DNA-binding MurR/RpiR family transcriptional regulator